MGGRQKGQPNHSTQLLKDAILQAATEEGGSGSLTTFLPPSRHVEQPARIPCPLGPGLLPLQPASDRDNPVAITSVTYHIVDTREQAEMIELSALTNGTKEPN